MITYDTMLLRIESRPVGEFMEHLIYHITHINNLAGIIKARKLLSKNQMLKLDKITGYKNIDVSYDHIQNRRAHTMVPVGRGGTLHDYVPFYFCPRSPMLYALKYPKPGQMKYMHGQREILHLVAVAEDVTQHKDLYYVFTDRHAVKAYASFYDDLKYLNALKWNAIHAHYWSEGETRELKQAEFLVTPHFPWELIKFIGVIDKKIYKEVEKILNRFPNANRPLIQVRREWYY